MPTITEAIIVALITSLIGGVLVAVINFFFLKDKTLAEKEKMLAEAEKIRTETLKIRKEAENIVQTSLELKDITQKAETQAQVTYYEDFSEMFIALDCSIQDEIEDIRKNGLDQQIVNLKLISVAMTYSWKYFISTKIPKIAQKYPSSVINLELLLVDTNYLGSLNLFSDRVNWTAESEQREREIVEFMKYCTQYQDRIRLSVRTYSNLPHWHGWLVNDRHLYMGRAKWDVKNGRPVLIVGQNEYRHYDKLNGRESLDRIRMFEQWHHYYFQYAFSRIISD
jgi:hypothetical protein